MEEKILRHNGKTKTISSICIWLALSLSWVTLCVADEALYLKNCGVCHTVNANEPTRQGPYLGDIVGRNAGAIDGFPYSSSVKALGFAWDAEKLEQWIAKPQAMAADSYMMYSQDDEAIRKGIVQYLVSLQ